MPDAARKFLETLPWVLVDGPAHIRRLLAECERLNKEHKFHLSCVDRWQEDGVYVREIIASLMRENDALEADRSALVAYVRVLEHDEDYYSRGPLLKDDINPELRDVWQALSEELKELIDAQA